MSKVESTDILRIQVIAARDLPNTDLIGKSDPVVTVIVGSLKQTTPVLKNTQNPVWNASVDIRLDKPQELKGKSVKFELADQDLLTKPDPLGSIEIPLAEIFAKNTATQTSGVPRDITDVWNFPQLLHVTATKRGKTFDFLIKAGLVAKDGKPRTDAEWKDFWTKLFK